ncbi:MAG: hypothetical protein MR878_04380 [Campylobacter sp.]|uniref:hypothetical protein n=1 Tax=Campylobacter sp. TaxID=205 RepID=UPI002AA7B061|nr:hypothetical protein [Campylobacter sp.]MCI7014606.1 hypothetical protein [Campylobacter sp.]
MLPLFSIVSDQLAQSIKRLEAAKKNNTQISQNSQEIFNAFSLKGSDQPEKVEENIQNLKEARETFVKDLKNLLAAKEKQKVTQESLADRKIKKSKQENSNNDEYILL